MTVEVPAEKVTSAIEAKLKNLTTQVKMSGFRPGKVPSASSEATVMAKRYLKKLLPKQCRQVIKKPLSKKSLDRLETQISNQSIWKLIKI